MTDHKEANMNQEREQTKLKNGLTRRDFLKVGVAAVAGAVAGALLPDLGKGARADGSAGSPQGAPVPDAPVEPVYTKRVFLPNITREYKDNTPLYLREFGAPERGVIMRNKVEQGGGGPSWIEIGDRELFENMLYLRETYGRPDLRLEITFYSTVYLLRRAPNIPPFDYPNTTELIPYGAWARDVLIFDENGKYLYTKKYPNSLAEYGERRFRRRDDGTLEFHITLPWLLEGAEELDDLQVNRVNMRLTGELLDRVFTTDENGKSIPGAFRQGTPGYQDLLDHPYGKLEGNIYRTTLKWVR